MKTAIDRSDIYRRLDEVQMSSSDRRHARASLHDAELVAGLLFRAVADIQAIASYVERGIKTMIVKPAKF